MFWKVTDRLLLPAFFFLIAFVAALTFWQLLISHRRTEIQEVTNEQTIFVKSKVESELKARVLPLEHLAGISRVREARPGMMESEAELVMSGYPAYQAIEWADPTFHVRWVTPRNGSEADLGADLGANENLRDALRAAEESGTAKVTHPVTLRQGGRGFLVCVPVYADSKLSGFLLGVFQYSDVLSSILQGTLQNYSIAVYDGDEEIYKAGAALSPREGAWAQSTGADFQQLTWRVRVWPKPETLSDALSPLPNFVFVGGILMAVLLAFSVYLGETAWLHAREFAAANKELEKQIVSREQAEEALRQAQKMEAVGRLAGGVAHDFNNLLMVIRGHAALSLRRLGPDGPLHRALTEILKSTDRASSLTKRLLAFSRKQVLQLRVLDLNTLVAQVQELLPPVLGDDINLVLDLDADLGHVKADAAQMEQVLMNLVINARDAMPRGGELMIQTANTYLDDSWIRRHGALRTGPHVMLAVRDTGHGMNEDTLSHVFEPFFTTKDISKGTGLGLASVYGTVRQSGGCVTVSSKVGRGTTVEIYLPSVEETVETVEAPKPVPQTVLANGTILVVEDDDAVRRMTREFLKVKGYTVIEASRAAEAIQLMQRYKETIDLVLTDVLMPGMKGRELVERLAELRTDMKVLYMSAYTEDAAVNIGVLDPGTQFIEKPFSPDELAGKVREVLGRSSTIPN
jgi:signal transduction histidine kinase/ActR/RegA family two-component response regulator